MTLNYVRPEYLRCIPSTYLTAQQGQFRGRQYHSVRIDNIFKVGMLFCIFFEVLYLWCVTKAMIFDCGSRSRYNENCVLAAPRLFFEERFATPREPPPHQYPYPMFSPRVPACVSEHGQIRRCPRGCGRPRSPVALFAADCRLTLPGGRWRRSCRGGPCRRRFPTRGGLSKDESRGRGERPCSGARGDGLGHVIRSALGLEGVVELPVLFHIQSGGCHRHAFLHAGWLSFIFSLRKKMWIGFTAGERNVLQTS